MPTANIINIDKEISLVSFIFHVLITWGTKDRVVKVAAIKPIKVLIFIGNVLNIPTLKDSFNYIYLF